jgi:hypothetical protein
MTSPKRLSISLLLIGFLFFALSLSFVIYTQSLKASAPKLVLNDPRSPTVVRIEAIKGLLGTADWGCTISVDGRRPTQYTGWPKDSIAPGAEPLNAIWHSEPDWVEIIVSSGQRLKLTRDTAAAKEARQSGEKHFFLDPHFEILPPA